MARRLRRNGSKTFIIAISGYGSNEAIERGAEAGFDAHLLKPVDLDRLNDVIANAKS